jgi:outer membrane protein
MKILVSIATAGAVLIAASAVQAAPKKAAAAPAAAAAPVATQRTPTGPALPPITHGAPIPGLCVYFDERAVGTSTAGQAAGARMQQLRAQIAAELQAEQTGIQTDGAALNAKKATLTPEQFAQQAQPIQLRAQALEAKAQTRQRELEATAAKAGQRIHTAIDPVLRSAYQSHSCAILLNGDQGVYLANPAMDLTAQVTAGLNAALPTLTFDREVLPAQAQ